MDINEIEKRRHDLLENLSKELNDSQIAAVVRKDEGVPEMVSAILDEMGDGDMEVTGDFYFRPLQSEEDGAWVFMSVITITDELPAEQLPALYESLSYVNFTLPAGCFSIDKDHKFLCFVLTSLMPAELSDEMLFKEIDIAVGNAFAIADPYIGILTDVLNGEFGAEGVVEFLGGPADEE